MGFDFQARTESQNGMTSIALGGELDMETAPVLQEALAQAERTGASTIVLDLQDLSFMDSTGLMAFLSARDRAELDGHDLILSSAGPSARRLFHITKTEFLLEERRGRSRQDAIETKGEER
jgi:anti-anti-sigma factor